MRVALPLLAVLSGCLGSSSELVLTVHLSDAALDSVPAFPVDLVVDYGLEDSPRRALSLCQREGEDFMQVEMPAPLYDRCPPPATITAILVPHEGACANAALSVTNDWPEDQQLARGEIVIFDEELCDVVEIRTLNVEPLPET